MDILYVRYNKNHNKTDEQINRVIEKAVKKFGIENEEDERQYNLKIVSYPTTDKKLQNKERKFLDEIINNNEFESFYIYNLKQESFGELKERYPQEDFVLLDVQKSVTQGKKALYLVRLLRKLYEKGSIESDETYILEHISDGKLTSDETLKRYLKDLYSIFPQKIVQEKKSNKYVYRFLTKGEIFDDVFQYMGRLDEIVHLIEVFDEEDLKKFSKKTQEAIKKSDHTVLFKTRPFENLLQENRSMIEELKEAIMQKRYVDIYGYKVKLDLEGFDKEDYEKIVPLKIVFMENNWYLAGAYPQENDEEIVRFWRINFIDDYKITDEIPQKQYKQAFYDYLEHFESPFTRYAESFKTATLKLSSGIVIQFQNKKHFPKQRDFTLLEDGSATIKVGYTQPMEIVPTIRKWLPDIEVVKSEDGAIEERLMKDLEITLKKLKGNQ